MPVVPVRERTTQENEPLVVDICRRLDGIPLAIELACARVRVLNLEQIAARPATRPESHENYAAVDRGAVHGSLQHGHAAWRRDGADFDTSHWLNAGWQPSC